MGRRAGGGASRALRGERPHGDDRHEAGERRRCATLNAVPGTAGSSTSGPASPGSTRAPCGCAATTSRSSPAPSSSTKWSRWPSHRLPTRRPRRKVSRRPAGPGPIRRWADAPGGRTWPRRSPSSSSSSTSSSTPAGAERHPEAPSGVSFRVLAIQPSLQSCAMRWGSAASWSLVPDGLVQEG